VPSSAPKIKRLSLTTKSATPWWQPALKNTAPVHKITIIPRTSGALGYTMQVDEQEKVLLSKEELFNKIVTITGGRSAEEVVFGSITGGASNDIEQATKIARAMVARLGMTEDLDMMGCETIQNAYLGGDASMTCSEQTSAKIDGMVLDIIKRAHAAAVKILTEHREDMDRLAEYLLKKETITGAEFMAILNHEDPEQALAKEAEKAKEEGKSKIEIQADSTASTQAFADENTAEQPAAPETPTTPATHSVPHPLGGLKPTDEQKPEA
jgi:cell division protease FtsH